MVTIRIFFRQEWNGLGKVISLKNLDGEEVNMIINTKCVLPEKITKDSAFTFQLYGKNKEKKIETNRMIVNQI